MSIFKSLFKGAEQRAAQRQARAGGSPAGGTRADQNLEKLRSAKKIMPMSHFDFLEKIAEGFVIEAYNSTKKKAEHHIKLDAYNLERLERAMAEMRGDAAPSGQARGEGSSAAAAHGSGGGKAVKKRLLVRSLPTAFPATTRLTRVPRIDRGRRSAADLGAQQQRAARTGGGEACQEDEV